MPHTLTRVEASSPAGKRACLDHRNTLAGLVLAVCLGATVAWLTVRQWLVRRTGTTTSPAESPAIPKEYADRIEKDLKSYE